MGAVISKLVTVIVLVEGAPGVGTGWAVGTRESAGVAIGFVGRLVGTSDTPGVTCAVAGGGADTATVG